MTADYDIAIVGGGVSGVYSAWRILQAAKDKGEAVPSIVLFEQNDRIGGRLLSLEPPGIPDTRVEIGGMRYSDAHRWVASLTEHLGLKIQPLPADRPENLAYVRGVRMRYQDRLDYNKVPYRLAPDERTPEALSSLIFLSAQKAIKEITGNPMAQPTPETWEKVRYTGTFHGKHLQNVAMRYIILNTISHEAFRMQWDIGGYDSVLHTWNAIDGFPWNLGDFAHPVDFHHIIDGYDQVPIQVAELASDLGAKINLNARVMGLTQEEDLFHLDVAQDGARTKVTAGKLIMAAPLRSLEILNHNDFFWAPESEEETFFNSVTPIPLYKLALCYKEPWWRELPPVTVTDGDTREKRRITSGKSNTDLPVRQCYYWHTDEDTGRSVVLIYDDGVDMQYWVNLRDPAEKRYPFDAAQVAGMTEPSQWKQHEAPEAMTLEVHRQLLELHGMEDADVPLPYAASYVDWGEDPYGGGANFWHVGVDSVSVAKKVTKPFDKDLFICGDCWSHEQGWAEGALLQAEYMLQTHFGLDIPSWFKPADIPPASPVASFNHVNIVTHDLDATCDFLTKYFGMVASKPVTTSADWVSTITGYKDAKVTFLAMTLPDQPCARIEVLYFHTPKSPDVPPDTWEVYKPGYRHICFETPDIHAKYKEIDADGYRFLSPPVYVEDMKVWTCYFEGPEKILVQLLQRGP